MKRKEQFLSAVEILAPGDKFIIKAAQFVREETLPPKPGGAALEFVIIMEKLKPFLKHRRTRAKAKPQIQLGLQSRVSSTIGNAQEQDPPQIQLRLEDALRLKSAEYWLKLGQPFQALCELDKLPEETRKHPWVLRVTVVAMGAIRGLHEYSVHAE